MLTLLSVNSLIQHIECDASSAFSFAQTNAICKKGKKNQKLRKTRKCRDEHKNEYANYKCATLLEKRTKLQKVRKAKKKMQTNHSMLFHFRFVHTWMNRWALKKHRNYLNCMTINYVTFHARVSKLCEIRKRARCMCRWSLFYRLLFCSVFVSFHFAATGFICRSKCCNSFKYCSFSICESSLGGASLVSKFTILALVVAFFVRCVHPFVQFLVFVLLFRQRSLFALKNNS